MINYLLYKLFKKQILLKVFKGNKRIYETNDRIFYDAFRYYRKGYTIRFYIW